MTTSRENSLLYEILGDGPIPPEKMAYFRSRLKNELYDLVLSVFLDKKISKAQLAKRLGKAPEQITRWLGSPGNWTLDTLSDLLLAMRCEPNLSVTDLKAAKENKTSQGEAFDNGLSMVDALRMTNPITLSVGSTDANIYGVENGRTQEEARVDTGERVTAYPRPKLQAGILKHDQRVSHAV